MALTVLLALGVTLVVLALSGHWSFVTGLRRRFDRLFAAHGLHPSLVRPGDAREWSVHYDGALAPGLPAGARLDGHGLLISVELTIADGRLDLPPCSARTRLAGPGAALLVTPPDRRAAIDAYLDDPPPGTTRDVRVAQSGLTLEATLPPSASDDAVAAALERLGATAEVVRRGLDRPIATQLAEAVADPTLPPDLRHAAACFVVSTCPESAEARRLAPTLLADDDPLVVITAAAVIGEPPVIVAALTGLCSLHPVPDAATLRLAALLDRLRAALDPATAARVALAITDPSLRTRWLEALLRAGEQGPPRHAAAADADPQVRAAIITRLAHHVGMHRALDPALQALLVTALTGHPRPARAAARALALYGSAAALAPLARWRAALTPRGDPTLRALLETVDLGIARMVGRAHPDGAPDPALIGRLAVVEAHGDGGLTVADLPGALSLPADGDPQP